MQQPTLSSKRGMYGRFKPGGVYVHEPSPLHPGSDTIIIIIIIIIIIVIQILDTNNYFIQPNHHIAPPPPLTQPHSRLLLRVGCCCRRLWRRQNWTSCRPRLPRQTLVPSPVSAGTSYDVPMVTFLPLCLLACLLEFILACLPACFLASCFYSTCILFWLLFYLAPSTNPLSHHLSSTPQATAPTRYCLPF